VQKYLNLLTTDEASSPNAEAFYARASIEFKPKWLVL
jgi:hypothetical protein